MDKEFYSGQIDIIHNVKAVSDIYSAEEAAVMALKAGCDMILMPDDFERAYNAVLNAVNNGEILVERIEESLMRIYRVKVRLH